MSAQNVQQVIEELDQEWVELIQEAFDFGLSADEIRAFLLEKHISA